MATAARESEWIDGAEAARVLDLPSARNVTALADEGLIGVRKLKGTYRRFKRSDCEQLARLSLVPPPKGPDQ